jgi:hypothetical protein
METRNSRELNKRGDLSNDRKPAKAWHWSSATAVMAVRVGKLSTRWMPATTQGQQQQQKSHGSGRKNQQQQGQS